MTHLATQRLDPESISRDVVMELEKVFPETALFVMLAENDDMVISAANPLGTEWLERVGFSLKSPLPSSQVLPPEEFMGGKDFFVVNDISKISSSFFQIATTAKGGSGSGLGLSMVYGIVQRHEGKIEVESELGKGTLFRIWFPLKTEALSTKEKPETKADKVPPLRVLVIDDDPRVQEALKAMLEHLGHQPVVVEDGEVGIAAFKHALEIGTPFDLVITDLGMPKIGGAEVSQQVKELSPNTPVLVITGWGTEQRPAHADYALSKPVRLSTLKEAIARIWEQRGKTTS